MALGRWKKEIRLSLPWLRKGKLCSKLIFFILILTITNTYLSWILDHSTDFKIWFLKFELLSHIYTRIMTFYPLMLRLAHYTHTVLVFSSRPIPAEKIPPHNEEWVINYLSLHTVISHSNKWQISSYQDPHFHEDISALYFLRLIYLIVI